MYSSESQPKILLCDVPFITTCSHLIQQMQSTKRKNHTLHIVDYNQHYTVTSGCINLILLVYIQGQPLRLQLSVMAFLIVW